jgi:hypothetical protein
MRKTFAKITGLLGSITQDKLLHFIAGFLIVAVCSLYEALVPYACAVATLVGFCKERYDSRHDGNVDAWDFAATLIGAVTMQIFVILYLITW